MQVPFNCHINSFCCIFVARFGAWGYPRVKREPGVNPGQTVLLCALNENTLRLITALTPVNKGEHGKVKPHDNGVGASQKTCQVANIETRDNA